MKKILAVLLFLLMASFSIAQSPDMFNYQGIARNSISNAVLTSQTIKLRLSILTGNSTGLPVYSETRTVSTNGYGLFTCRIGDPTDRLSFTGSLSNINWSGFPSGEPKYLKVEMDASNGNNFTYLGSTQLISVPYALTASKAYPIGNAGGDFNGSTFPDPKIAFPLIKTFSFPSSQLVGMTNSSSTGTLGAITGTSASTDAFAVAITGTISSTTPGNLSAGLKGINNGTGLNGVGVIGSQAGTGTGVYGTTPNGIGVSGITAGPNSVAIKGQSVLGIGVHGNSSSNIAGWFQNTNAVNAAATLLITTNGIGDGASSITTGTGRPAFFQVNNQSNTSNVIEGQTNGKGSVAVFSNTNTANNKEVLNASTNGINSVEILSSNNVTNDKDVFNASTSGLNKVGVFTSNNTENTKEVVNATTNGMNSVAILGSNNPLNDKDVINASTTGLNRVGVFVNNNANNGKEVINATTNGLNSVAVFSSNNPVDDKDVLNVNTTGMNKVGVFANTNANNGKEVINAVTNGLNSVAVLSSSNSSNSMDVLNATTNGLNKVGVFVSTNANNSKEVLNASSNGMNSVAILSSSNTSNDKDVLNATTNGLNKVGVFVSNNPNNTKEILNASTNGMNNVAILSSLNQGNDKDVLNATTNGLNKVGVFTNTNSNNNKEVINASTNGMNSVAILSSSNPTTDKDVLNVTTNGLNKASVFINNNANNTKEVINATTNGMNSIATFLNTNAANSSNIFDVRSNGIGPLGFWRNTNANNISDLFDVHSNGLGNIGVFHNTNILNNNNALNISTTGTGYAAYIQSTNAPNYKALLVDGSVRINGSQTINGQVFVNDATQSTSTTTGAFVINGGVGIGKNLNVGGIHHIWNNTQSSTVFNGALIVDGGIGLQKNLNVGGHANIFGHVNIGGYANIDSILYVTANADYAAYFTNTSNANGIAIQVNNSLPNNNNNFITFNNNSGNTVGRIEGQTYNELITSADYQWYIAMNTLNSAISTYLIISDLAGLDDFDAAIVEGIQMVAANLEWLVKTTDMEAHVGVSYESGNGDYAEWLRKEKSFEKFSPGDIISVTGGLITKNTDNGDHFLAISTTPIILGKMPSKEQENNYEKVAFLGQVPVKVIGKVNIGDFIIPSGKNDGMGIAVPKSSITLQQIKKVIGTAWSESENQNNFSLINVAIGLSNNIMGDKIQLLESEIQGLRNNLTNIEKYLSSKDTSFRPSSVNIATNDIEKIETENNAVKKIYNSDRFQNIKQMMLQNQTKILEFLSYVRQEFKKRNINIDQFPKLKKFVTDPAYFIDSFGKDQSYFR